VPEPHKIGNLCGKCYIAETAVEIKIIITTGSVAEPHHFDGDGADAAP
jgi:hypothetical protein